MIFLIIAVLMIIVVHLTLVIRLIIEDPVYISQLFFVS